jgi:hypothetical protein
MNVHTDQLTPIKPTEYDLAIYMLQSTPTNNIAHLIQKMPTKLQNQLFCTLMPNYSICNEYNIDLDCVLNIAHCIEKKARNNERIFLPSSLEPVPLVTDYPTRKLAYVDLYPWNKYIKIKNIEGMRVPVKRPGIVLEHLEGTTAIIPPGTIHIFNRIPKDSGIVCIPLLTQTIKEASKGGCIRSINGQEERSFEAIKKISLDNMDAILNVQVNIFKPYQPTSTRIDTYYLSVAQKSRSIQEALSHHIMYVIKTLNMTAFKAIYRVHYKKNNYLDTLMPKIAAICSQLSYNDNQKFLSLLAQRPLCPLDTPMPLVLNENEYKWLLRMSSDVYDLIKCCGYITPDEYKKLLYKERMSELKKQKNSAKTINESHKKRCVIS